jgi:hypothetical protein
MCYDIEQMSLLERPYMNLGLLSSVSASYSPFRKSRMRQGGSMWRRICAKITRLTTEMKEWVYTVICIALATIIAPIMK